MDVFELRNQLIHEYEGQEQAASIKDQADSFINELLELKLINHAP